MASYTNTKDGKVEAPSWYKNADGSTPSTMQKGLTKEKWEAQNAAIKQKKEAEANKVQAKEKASAYLKSGGSRDGQYDKILKEGGLNNTSYQKMVGADKKAQFEKQKDFRKESAKAYGQSRKDIQEVKAKHGPKGVYGMQSALKNQSVDNVGARFQDKGEDMGAKERDHAALIRTFQNSGYDYSHDEVQRSKGNGAYQAQNSHIYDQYGGGKEGWKNWRDNYSIFSGENAHDREQFYNNPDAAAVSSSFTYNLGNFKGSQDIMNLDKVLEVGRNQQAAVQNYKTSNEFKNKYSKYDWAN